MSSSLVNDFSKLNLEEKKTKRRLIGFCHDKQLELYGGFIYKDTNGKNVVVTEVVYEDMINNKLINYDGTKIVGVMDIFVKHLCPTKLEKVPNCICKQMLGLFIDDVGYVKMAIRQGEKLENISEPFSWRSRICN